MGKSVGFLGPISGRVGNTVGYVLKDASKQTQGWRVYQPNVGNPQTDAQMQQRIRLTAINNQYRALRDIINRGYEGLNYGNVSRRKFLSMAMGQRFEGPWLVKDDKRPVPVLNIPITLGGLPQVTSVYRPGGQEFVTNLVLASPAPISNMGVLSRFFTENGFQNGDQVTFIMCKLADGATVLNSWYSFYLDDTSTESKPEWLDQIVSTGDDGELTVSAIDGIGINALAIAVSRDGENSHLRSTSYWTIDDQIEAIFYDPTDYRQNSPSYIHRRGASTNWELDEDSEGAPAPEGSSRARFKSGEPAVVDGFIARGDFMFAKFGAEEYPIFCDDERSPAHSKYMGANRQWLATSHAAPSGATDATTIRQRFSSDSDAYDQEFDEFMLANGFSWSVVMGG